MKKLLYLLMSTLIVSLAIAQQPQSKPKEKKIVLQDTDLVSVVLTVKTAKELLAALTSRTVVNDRARGYIMQAITATLDPPPPLPPFPDPTQ